MRGKLLEGHGIWEEHLWQLQPQLPNLQETVTQLTWQEEEEEQGEEEGLVTSLFSWHTKQIKPTAPLLL